MVSYYKERQLLYYKMRQVLKSATIITKCDSTDACFRFSICLSVIFAGLSYRQMYRKFKK